MPRRIRISLFIAALLPAVTAAGPAYAADAASYEMVAYVDGAGSEEIFDGRYKDAIAAVAAARTRTSEDALKASTNLCVAFTLSADFSAAGRACSRALEIARKFDAGRGGLRSMEETGKALSNLGVLKAVSGDTAGAAEDFTRAARLGRLDSALRNLDRLETVAPALASIARASDPLER
jgi:hypothetical protein